MYRSPIDHLYSIGWYAYERLPFILIVVDELNDLIFVRFGGKRTGREAGAGVRAGAKRPLRAHGADVVVADLAELIDD